MRYSKKLRKPKRIRLQTSVTSVYLLHQPTVEVTSWYMGTPTFWWKTWKGLPA